MVEPVDSAKLIVPARSNYRVKGSGRKDNDRQKGDFSEEVARLQEGGGEGKKHPSDSRSKQPPKSSGSSDRDKSTPATGGEADREGKERIAEQGKLVDIIA